MKTQRNRYDKWQDAREKLARLLKDDPGFAEYWSHPLDEGDLDDELVQRAESGEFAREVFTARYGTSSVGAE